jgi:hypothetical protein
MVNRNFATYFCLAAVLPLLLLIVFCSRDTNPFADISNSRAVVMSSSIKDGDTVRIYNPDTIDIACAVIELMDSFTVEIRANRHFQHTVVDVSETPAGSIWTFPVSFFDTGSQEIIIRSFRRNFSEPVSENYKVFVVSPLKQDDVTDRIFGEEVELSTPDVKSPDVRYHWDFGRGIVISSVDPQVFSIITDAGLSDTGWLWVSDVSGAYPSPAVPFSFSFDDREGPSIVCINDGYFGKDTVMSIEAQFALRMRISDRGESPVREAMADNEQFTIDINPVFVAVLEGMDGVDGFRPVSILATDDHGNQSADTIFVGYDATLDLPRQGTSLQVLVPSADSAFQSVETAYILGVLWNYTGGHLDAGVSLSVNGETDGEVYAVTGTSTRNEWSGTVTLAEGINLVGITAVSLLGDTVSDTIIHLVFDASMPDTSTPVIAEISVDAIVARKQTNRRIFTTADTAMVRVIAFDEGSGISGIWINGLPMNEEKGSFGHIWTYNLGLKHAKEGNNLFFLISDKAGHDAFDTITVFSNNPPEMKQAPTPPNPIFVGSEYRDLIITGDKDYDSVSIQKSPAPQGLTLSNRGEIKWSPGIDDTGANTLSIILSDGYEQKTFRYVLYVRDTVDFSLPSFETAAEDFPAFIETGAGAFEMELNVIDGRGTRPYIFSATAGGGRTQPAISGSGIVWEVQKEDTGWCVLTVIVTDFLNRADTINPVIYIAEPNRPCSLSVSHGLDTLAGGMLDFSECTAPETLSFRVHDPDLPVTENHVLSVNSGNAAVTGATRRGETFIVVINPEFVHGGIDTLSVSLSDRVGHNYSMNVLLAKISWNVHVNTAGAGMSENVYGYPLLVRLSGGDFAGAAPFYGSIGFRRSRDGAVFPFEIERWDESANEAEIWVKVDTVFKNNSTQKFEMFVYQDNSGTVSDGSAVFDTSGGFDGVWHMNENPDSGGQNAVRDRTLNANHMTPDGLMSSGNVVNGVCGKGMRFDGVDDYLMCSSPASSLKFYESLTISAWVKILSHTAPNNASVISRQFQTGIDESWTLFMMKSNKPSLIAGSVTTPAVASAINDDSWYHIAGIRNGTTGYLYVNGTFAASGIWPEIRNDNNEVTIGANYNGIVFASDFFNGVIDEVRAGSGARSESWIKLDYETQRTGSAAVTVE